MPETTTDDVVSYSLLTGFQCDIVRVLAEDARYGLAVKSELEDLYDEEVNHGRLYPNLDQLVEGGYVKTWDIDKRTNGYALTDEGAAAFEDYIDSLPDAFATPDV